MSEIACRESPSLARGQHDARGLATEDQRGGDDAPVLPGLVLHQVRMGPACWRYATKSLHTLRPGLCKSPHVCRVATKLSTPAR